MRYGPISVEVWVLRARDNCVRRRECLDKLDE